MVDSSWTSTDQFNEIGSVWKDSMRKIQLIETRNLRRRETSLHSELKALRWAMESILQHSTCQRFETYCKDLIAMITDPQAWPNFSTELELGMLVLFIDLFVLLVVLFRSGYPDHLKIE
ncbi:hypothetical protein DY000_02049052 [Brassica cretica]|uniref:Uncharacterized protein n=1 Tax=Brassica cretica TaxID=69181 RepID=A0ABQ7F029_BRACR|nr:hypothetical protein DY000_02049052 [Brassica cretica]